MTVDLAGSRVLLTGASSGIGPATALAFAERGATVGICAHRRYRLAGTGAASEAAGAVVHRWVVDRSDLGGIDDFGAQVLARRGWFRSMARHSNR